MFPALEVHKWTREISVWLFRSSSGMQLPQGPPGSPGGLAPASPGQHEQGPVVPIRRGLLCEAVAPCCSSHRPVHLCAREPGASGEAMRRRLRRTYQYLTFFDVIHFFFFGNRFLKQSY